MWTVCVGVGYRGHLPIALVVLALPVFNGQEWACWYTANKQSGCGNSVGGLWVSDVVSVWAWVTASICLFLMTKHLMSKVGVATLCGCVCCGMWVPLMWSVRGRGLPWAFQSLARFQVVCLYAFNEQSRCGSYLRVCLLWSVGAVSGATVGVATPCRCLQALRESLSGCVSVMSEVGLEVVFCGLWVPLMWSVCGRGRSGPLPM